MEYITYPNKVVVVVKGRPHTVQSSDVRYSKVVEAIEDRDEEAVAKLLSKNSFTTLIDADSDEFETRNGEIYFKGFKVEGTLATTLSALIEQGADLDRWKKFVEKLSQNPSATSVKELFEFMDYKQLALTEHGDLVAYKGVRSDFYSAHGNKATIVNKGKVDSAGRIYNGIGEEIEVNRNQVDDNRNKHCSFGLHAGSYNYAVSFSAKLLSVIVNPKDVVSVPSDFNCQKMRVCAYKVKGEVEKEFDSVALDEDSDVDFNEQKSKYFSKVDAVEDSLAELEGEGLSKIKVKKVKKSLAKEGIKITNIEILGIAEESGYTVEINDKKTGNSLILLDAPWDDVNEEEEDPDWIF